MRYIDADALYKKLYPIDLVDKRLYTINAKAVADAIAKTPTAEVVPKSEVDRLNAVMKDMDEQRAYTINMLGENLENAKAEVERLQEALSKAESDGKNYKKVAEYQQSLSVKRYHEIKQLNEEVDRLQEENETLKDNNEHLAVLLEESKQAYANYEEKDGE